MSIEICPESLWRVLKKAQKLEMLTSQGRFVQIVGNSVSIELHQNGPHSSHMEVRHCDVTCIVWHDAFIFDMTHSYARWLIHMWHDSYRPHSSHMEVRDVTRIVWHDSFTCDMTHSYATWFIHMRHDSFILYSLCFCGIGMIGMNLELRWGWVFLERTRILSGIQFTTHFSESRAAESKRRALWNYFSERICYMFLISKCREDRDLNLCTTSVLAFGEPQRNGRIWFFLRRNTVFLFRKSLPRLSSPNASTEVVHRPESGSFLHFDIRNI